VASWGDRKVTPGVTELSRVRVPIDLAACFLDVGSSYPGGAYNLQGWGCSPIKRERELGLDRRETGRILSDRYVGRLMVRSHQYERNMRPAPLVYRLSDKASPGSHAPRDKRWKHLSAKPDQKIISHSLFADIISMMSGVRWRAPRKGDKSSCKRQGWWDWGCKRGASGRPFQPAVLNRSSVWIWKEDIRFRLRIFRMS
jgi:hypothetical protein